MAGGELAGGNPTPQGKPCPKCGYVRKASDANPDWQCPACGIAYAKFAGTTHRHVARAAADRSVYALIAANLVAAAIALGFRMDLRDLMLVYWTQSVIIGITHFIRMASLRSFSTEGVKMNDESVEAIPENKWRFAIFFLMHYGFFHLGYLMFIAFGADRPGATPIATGGLWLCALVFAVNHGFSLRHNMAADRQGRPNLGTLMMLPYARILPMHVTILIGGAYFGGFRALLAFVILKTLADVLMHVLEHAVLQKEPLLHRLD